ncbi:GGDEF domain-containing phosphodiesterase [Lachnoclostridium sp. Marseille-P6806]|uniref:GGDEF domain-containing phosphodiesterase n=1 Tax=Lachnoclostridium sp. Marseille-P6806 TaxID=2364793 RepID=UPI0013EEF580|nr:GGDEF domain-containing phosphodiesterase [Lachnoclostridium sp. Marseille-P6806]
MSNEIYKFSPEFRRAYECLHIPLVICQSVDGEAVTLLVSDGYCREKKCRREEIEMENLTRVFRYVEPEDLNLVLRVGEALTAGECECDVVYRSRSSCDGPCCLTHVVGRSLFPEEGVRLTVLLFINLSIREQMSFLRESGSVFRRDPYYRDPVTELPNLNFFHKFAAEEVVRLRAEGGPPVCVYLDIDGMRGYNEQYGFAEGDKLLFLVGEILQLVFSDGAVFRIADDHFAVLTTRIGEVESRIAAACQQVRCRALGNGARLRAGAAPVEADETGCIRALDRARFAMKSIGSDMQKRCALYSAKLEDAYWRQRYIRDRFEEALANRWIRVFYQAIVRTKAPKVCNFEALARWIDPESGIISPAEFVPILEKYHLVHRLDMYMLEEVARQVAVRREAGLALIPVSVNLSAQDFDTENAVERILGILDRYGVEHECLILEITERDVAAATECFRKQIRELQEHGIRIWVDDFGSGYSALNVLHQYTFDLIKLDIRFMRELDEHGGANRVILKSVVKAADQLGVETLAEGVETEEQQRFLEEIGCGRVQGYLHAEPKDFDELLFQIKSGEPMLPCEMPGSAM